MARPLMTIAVDIDDVISASAEGFLAWGNETYGTNLTIEDYQEHWGEMWKIDHAEVVRRSQDFYDSGSQERFAPVEEAHEVLKTLKERFRLITLTSRRGGSGLTERWLNTHYAGIFEDIIFSGFYNDITEASFHKTKGSIAKEAGVDFLVDDQLKHVIAAAEHGISGVLFGNYPWNQTNELPQDVVRAHRWRDVLDYFSDK